MQERIYLSPPDVGQAEEDALVAALRSGWVAPLGPYVDQFEAQLAELNQVQHAVALSSGTAGLHLGLLALGVGPGDVVPTSSLTFAATANAIVYTGATPYFIDADPVTGNMDSVGLAAVLAELKAAGTPAKVIVPVDLLGKVADHDQIGALATEYGCEILSDAAESLGATRGGRPAGSFGKAAVVSFNGNKVITTSGGGAVLTDDAEIAAQVRYLATQARLPVVHYEHADVGYNYRLSNLLAALGTVQLARLPEMIARRRDNREFYRQLFSGVPGVRIFQGDADREDNCWLTALLINPEISVWKAADLQEALMAENIECRPLWKPMHLQPVFQGKPAWVSGAAERIFQTGITVPSGSRLTAAERDRIAAVVRRFTE